MQCYEITYIQDGWTVTERKYIVREAELPQYGSIGSDTGWVGNPSLVQRRYIVSKMPSTTSDCCKSSG